MCQDFTGGRNTEKKKKKWEGVWNLIRLGCKSDPRQKGCKEDGEGHTVCSSAGEVQRGHGGNQWSEECSISQDSALTCWPGTPWEVWPSNGGVAEQLPACSW